MSIDGSDGLNKLKSIFVGVVYVVGVFVTFIAYSEWQLRPTPLKLYLFNSIFYFINSKNVASMSTIKSIKLVVSVNNECGHIFFIISWKK